MADYVELVKDLLHCATSSEACTSCNRKNERYCQENLHTEAADAIEELSKYANTMRRLKCEGWYLQQNKYHDGYQAIATMPLPEPPKEET